MNQNYYGSNSGMNTSGMQIDSAASTTTIYVCGSCGNDNELKPRANIICKECNGRIFYKKRTKRIVQYEAR